MFSINVTLRRVSAGAVGWSECGGVYGSGGKPAECMAVACLLCLRR